ncbi:MAG: hypothetical protein JNN12_10300 [Bacteroidetes Order II. Incertae sedis bacterium]|nr:hypothetical protein [Bacteroidetes Order II. bacterium]
MKNRNWNVVKGAYFFAFLFLLGMILPAQLDADMMKWGFGVAFLCLFGIIMTLVTAYYYTRQARELDKLLNDEGTWAKWEVLPEEWEAYLNISYKTQKSRNMVVLRLILVITLVIVIFLTIVSSDPLFLLIGLGIALVAIIPAFLAPHWYRYQQRQNRMVLLGEKGAYAGGRFVFWDMMTVARGQVFLETEENPYLLVFPYTYMSGPTVSAEDAFLVPVPEVNLPAARQVMKRYNGRFSAHQIEDEDDES